MKAMTQNYSRQAAALAVFAAALLPADAAQAQWYSSVSRQPSPLYPYALQNPYRVQADQPYAVEVAPNTYVIQRPSTPRRRSRHASNPPLEPVAPKFDRPLQKADPALIEELRRRGKSNKTTMINTTKIVREKPVVIETKRYVDDSPRVIERHHVVEDKPARSHSKRAVAEDGDSAQRASKDDGKKRVIAADAEITILGPDRMSIRLFRKSGSSKANARAE